MTFEEWAKETFGDNVIDGVPRYKSHPFFTDLKMAYSAGVQAERERCARIAEIDDTVECGCSSDYECSHCAIKNNIATAIRGQGGVQTF